MSYPAVPDRRIPYDDDGTVVATGNLYAGVTAYASGSAEIVMNSAPIAAAAVTGITAGVKPTVWFFFPEQREVTAFYGYMTTTSPGGNTWHFFDQVQGSNDTTNGLDGNWETASLSGANTNNTAFDWRSSIASISFTGPKRVVRFSKNVSSDNPMSVYILHVYGQKAAGQTPDDILFLDGLASYAEFASVEDFGDMPLGTSSVRTFKVKNGSATHTANTVNLQCNDADFAISTDGVTWVTTINIASLAAGASSAVLYIRNTAPAVGGALGPRFARVVATVASYT